MSAVGARPFHLFKDAERENTLKNVHQHIDKFDIWSENSVVFILWLIF